MITVGKKRPLGALGTLLLGAVTLCVGVLVIYYIAAEHTLICDRADNSCVLQQKRMFREAEVVTTLNLSDITGAELQEVKTSKGNSQYQVMLLTENLRVPFTDGMSTGYGSSSKLADKINNFLHSSDKSFSVTQSATIIRVFGFVFVAAGGYVLLSAMSTVLIRLLRLVFILSR